MIGIRFWKKNSFTYALDLHISTFQNVFNLNYYLYCTGQRYKLYKITAANIAVVYISELCYQLVRYDEQATAFLISN